MEIAIVLLGFALVLSLALNIGLVKTLSIMKDDVEQFLEFIENDRNNLSNT